MNYFGTVSKIQYEGKQTENRFALCYYNSEEETLGESVRERPHFMVAYWHTITADGSDPFGAGTYQRNWEGNNPMEAAKNRVETFFEILERLGAEHFCFHNVDITPQSDPLEESFQNIDTITDPVKEKTDQTGIKLLWNTTSMLTHPCFVSGAATTNNVDVYTIAATQVKKGLNISKKLNDQNYIFWGRREGHESLLNTNMSLELDNSARFYKMAVIYTKKIDYQPQLLIEPKPKEPSKHQYDLGAATSIAFIMGCGLQDHFKLNLKASHTTLAGHAFEHEVNIARGYNALGPLDANQDDLLSRQGMDESPTNICSTTLVMYEVSEDGGIVPGGINFDAKVRQTSLEIEDLILTCIAGIDIYARGLRVAAKMEEERFFEEITEERYASFA